MLQSPPPKSISFSSAWATSYLFHIHHMNFVPTWAQIFNPYHATLSPSSWYSFTCVISTTFATCSSWPAAAKRPVRCRRLLCTPCRVCFACAPSKAAPQWGRIYTRCWSFFLNPRTDMAMNATIRNCNKSKTEKSTLDLPALLKRYDPREPTKRNA